MMAIVALTTACTVHQSDVPPLVGPSEFALSITLTTTPDSINRDGASQSAVVVVARGPDGRPLAGVAVRLDMLVDGNLQDFGTLSARNVVTGSDGRAIAVYTAPAAAPPGTDVAVRTVTIRATPIGSNFQTSNVQTSEIRLMPTGVILPPAQTPTASFTVTPTPAQVNVPTNFDASASCGGPVTAGVCPPGSSAIRSYAWAFGDGATGSGRNVTHTYTASGTYTVTLTVTNDRGVAASTTQTLAVSTAAAPSADFVFSPTNPNVGDEVVFNAGSSRAAAGRRIVRYHWNFGDGETGTGETQDHDYASAGAFAVVLTVTDDAGGEASVTRTVNVGSGNPTAILVINKTGGNSIFADGSGSSAAQGSTIASYTFVWGDNTANTVVAPPVTGAPHTFPAPGSYTVRLIVTDSRGRTGTVTQAVTVP